MLNAYERELRWTMAAIAKHPLSEKVIKDRGATEPVLEPRQLIAIVSQTLEIPVDDILSRSRLQPLTDARCIISFHLRNQLKMHLKDIAANINLTNHASVIYLLRSYANRNTFFDGEFQDKASKVNAEVARIIRDKLRVK